MQYRVIGIMSGSSLDGLDIVYTEFENIRGQWQFTIAAAECIAYSDGWLLKLSDAAALNAYQYQLLHHDYGKYLGEQVNDFIERNNLHHKVQLIASHGHTVFHAPQLGMTAQLGKGAAIAAATGINTVSDLRSLDVAFGGQGAPIVPMGEKLLFRDAAYFLNLGGIANISIHSDDDCHAFDICACNQILNALARKAGKEFDDGGTIAVSGNIHLPLLNELNELDYYKQPHPKSLANSFSTEVVFPVVEKYQLPVADLLRTYTEHIAQQVAIAVTESMPTINSKMLITGGGAFNTFLIERIAALLAPANIHAEIPDRILIKFKEALIMGLLGILRWREENTVLQSVTGATRSSIGGAVWIGQEA